MGLEDEYRYVKDEGSESETSAELERETLMLPSQFRRGLFRSRGVSYTVFTLSSLLIAISSSWITYLIGQAHRGTAPTTVYDSMDMNVPPSVAISKIDRGFYEKRFDHFNFTTNEWGQHPTENPNVNKLWASLGIHRNHLWLPKAQGEAMGLDPKKDLWIPNVPTSEDEGAFPVLLESTHQIHCLDVLRKNLWYNREWYEKNVLPEYVDKLDRAHINHCLDALRQKLMCDADVGLMTWSWVDTINWGLPNFNRPRKCHRYEPLVDYIDEWESKKPLNVFFKGPDRLFPPDDAELRTYRSYWGKPDFEDWGTKVQVPDHEGRKWKHANTPDVNPDDNVW